MGEKSQAQLRWGTRRQDNEQQKGKEKGQRFDKVNLPLSSEQKKTTRADAATW